MLSHMLSSLKGIGDPLADAVLLDYRNASSATKALLEKGMHQGVLTISEAPQSFIEFLRDSEASLALMQPSDIEQAIEPYAWIGPLWLSVSLGPGSLAHTYADPGISSVLMQTKNLLPQTVSRRLLETQFWNLNVIKSGGLRVGGSGYVHTLQVRLLHAQVRLRLLQSGWRDVNGHDAAPIDQLQMLRTWLDFAVVPFNALDMLGLSFSDDQRIALFSLWRLVGRLLGLEPEFFSHVSEYKIAQELLCLVDAELPLPNEDSRMLTKSMLEAIGHRLAPALGMPVDVSVLLMFSLCRLFHGEKMAHYLGVTSNWTSALIPMIADANRFRFRRMEEESDYRRAVTELSIKNFEAIVKNMPNATMYQSMTTTLASERLPRI